MARKFLEPAVQYTKKQIINAWCMYDWANSAFATTIMAAVLPVYYSQVAGATLPSDTVATAYWSLGLSASLLIVALLSPLLGTISDLVRSKKRFLALFVGLGVLATGAMVGVDTGDWLLATVLFIMARIGFSAANVFYDALLPHIAKGAKQDEVSARGFAMGYLGGGILLALNILMIQWLPGTWGPRLSFLSVALWWALFSVPIFRRVPEPLAATAQLAPGENVLSASFGRLWATLKDIRRYSELFKYLIAFLIYNDGIGTIISVSAIYGTELGFNSVLLILALLLVQFVGIPFSLIFGRLSNRDEPRRPIFLAFVLFNLVTLPLAGIVGARVLPTALTGAPLPPYPDTATAVGEGVYRPEDIALRLEGAWDEMTLAADVVRADEDVTYAVTDTPGASYTLRFNGQEVEVVHSVGPDHGIWTVEIDGEPMIDPDTGAPLRLNAYAATTRYGVRRTLSAPEPGEHTLRLINTGDRDPRSTGTRMTVAQIEVRPPIRLGNLGVILGSIVALEAVGVAFALLLGPRWFAGLTELLDTRRSIILALLVYVVIAIWGFFLNSVFEFWFLAWMVAMVQGGSQALSRSLYATLSPAAKSGEFFGLFGVMEKFSAIIGPLLFALAAATFGSSRPAILSLIVLFFVGIVVLQRVDIEEGIRVAREEDAAAGLV
jgi:UMF1 family MFS transporter